MRFQVLINQAEIHRMTRSDDVEERKKAVEELKYNFAILKDKKQAWEDLIWLTSDTDWHVKHRSADAVDTAFSQVPDKKQAWNDLHLLTSDNDRYVRMCAAEAVVTAFSHLPDKEQAWDDLVRLTYDNDRYVRRSAAYAVVTAFTHVPDKKQAWDILIRLTSDSDRRVHLYAASALGSAFSNVPDKRQAWDDLHQLTCDTDVFVRIAGHYSSGRVSIFKASEAENENSFKKEMETAMEYFEKASKEAIYFNSEKDSGDPDNVNYDDPAIFCLPFYRSFYALTFKKEEEEVEVQKYLSKAKSAVGGSESKEKLLEAVENLGNALKEAHKARDFSDIKADLNAYRRYCERACELLDTTEENAPGASRLIRRGLPIIDERIKGIIAEIQEKAKALCKQVKDTEYKEIGQQVNNVGQELLKVIDPIRLEKEVSHMLIPLSAMCKKMPEEDRGEACEILKQINEEQNVEDKLPLISMFLSKISTQMDKKIIYVNVEKSKNVQVSIGKDNYQIQSSNSEFRFTA